MEYANPARATAAALLLPYVRLARVDHWFKNAFMLAGALLGYFYAPRLFGLAQIRDLALAVAGTCLVASSNYVLNELLDAKRDRLHPTKKTRPAASGQVRARWALFEWLLLGTAGVGLALVANRMVALWALVLWVMGIVYNVPPVRSKELPYVDVLTESANNPIRLMLGWHAVVSGVVAPLSLLLCFWMLGAFFMATKRFAEYRAIGDKAVAASYRSSFRFYDADRLLVSMVFYSTTAALFAGIFIVRYKLELILSIPLAAGFIAYYLHLGLREDSPAQAPEKLHRERMFVLYSWLMVAVFVLLMFLHIPALYEIFNVSPSSFAPLWRLGGP